MDWLKKIIEAAKIENGAINVDELMKSINAEFPKYAVPKEVFNTTNDSLKDATKTIAELKAANTTNEELQKKIAEHETTITTLKTDAVRKEKESKVKQALEKAGAIDPDYIIFKSGGIDKFEMDKDGAIKDIDNVIKQTKENTPNFFKAAEEKDDKKPGGQIFEKKLAGGAPGTNEEPASLADAIRQHYKK